MVGTLKHSIHVGYYARSKLYNLSVRSNCGAEEVLISVWLNTDSLTELKKRITQAEDTAKGYEDENIEG